MGAAHGAACCQDAFGIVSAVVVCIDVKDARAKFIDDVVVECFMLLDAVAVVPVIDA